MTAETPILTKGSNGDPYVNGAKEPWSCERCITDYYEGDLRRISIQFSTRPSRDAVAIQVQDTGLGFLRFWRGKDELVQYLLDPMDEFLLRHFTIPHRVSLTLYYTVYER